ncbi:hypothetical protein GSI_03312 [Ganoderma sinense ZZ0214-1]|uniref:Transporter n=1 Tax=Ganoderma sinense ZZ0214-1 TaxID=1077348 RepID=A0A2G8SL95_9APHY|nr:hypothetical protein GSI_03312 [Ganoderma sinense ZZ0214-1]
MPSTRFFLLAVLLVFFAALAVDAAPIPTEDADHEVIDAVWLSVNQRSSESASEDASGVGVS